MTIATIIVTFVAGLVIGALVVYKWEEYTLTTMFKQCAELERASKELREEREDYRKTRAMLQAIDNVPEYLRDKYDISKDEHVEEYDSENDDNYDAEDYDAIYN